MHVQCKLRAMCVACDYVLVGLYLHLLETDFSSEHVV